MTTPQPPGQVQPGTRLAGRYELLAPIASGGMAQVWRAKDTILDRLVAVKILHSHLAVDAGFVARFRREAISSARLSHNSIVAVYDTISDNGIEAIVMELINGKTLRTILDERRALPADQVISIGRQISDALAEAHRSGIVHRDIKPANIMVDNDQRVVVTDFGIAKANKDADLTHTGTLLGTAKYLAPEQVAGEPVDARADLYSVGVVLFEAATGAPPFKAETDAATALARLQGSVPRCSERVAGVPVDLDNVIATAMARHPEQRYDRAETLMAALAAVNVQNLAPLQTAPPVGYDASQAHSVGVTGQAPPVQLDNPGASAGAGQAAPPSDGTAMMSDSMIMETPHQSKSRGGKDRRRDGRGPDRRQKRAGRSRGWMGRTAVGLLIIAGLMIAGLLALGVGGGFSAFGSGGVDAGSVADPIIIVDGFEYDPAGGGVKFQRLVPRTFDGDEEDSSGNRWYTSNLSDDQFEDRDGVGVFYQLENASDVSSVSVITKAQGWAAEIWVGDDPEISGDVPRVGSPAEFGQKVGEIGASDDSQTIDVTPTETEWVLVWYTRSGQTVNSQGQLWNRIEVREVIIG